MKDFNSRMDGLRGDSEPPLRHVEETEQQTAPEKPPQKREAISRATRAARINYWGLAIYGVILVVFALAGIYTGHFVATLPIMDIEDAVTNYQQNVTTYIFDGTGEGTLGELAEERRVLISYDQIPQSFIQALISIEDKDFLHHHGVDIMSIGRAFWANLTSGRVVQGGSTISQQLIKNLFLSPEQTYSRKIKEAILALQLEAKYTKAEILGFYCNTIPFGYQRHGIEAAARFYLGVTAGELTLSQSALLAGIIRAPARYNPFRHPDRAIARRNFVLRRMAALGNISEEAAEAATGEPLGLRERGTTISFAPFFVEEVRKFLVERYGRQEAYGGGLRVFTTLDPALQRAAESAVIEGLYELAMRQRLHPALLNVVDNGEDLDGYQHPDWESAPTEGRFIHALVVEVQPGEATLRIGGSDVTLIPRNVHIKMMTHEERNDLRKALRPGDIRPVMVDRVDEEGKVTQIRLGQEPTTEGSLVAIEVETGRILAMVGGSDFNKSQFNKAVQAPRQTGSAFKPIVLATALENSSVTLGTTLFDEPTVFDDPHQMELYEPANYKHEYIGITTVRDIIEKSRNIPAIKLMLTCGIEDTIAMAKRMGVGAELIPILSLALGSIEMSLLELSAVYSVFPNRGVAVEPYMIERISDHNSNVLYEHTHRAQTAMSTTTAYLATQALVGVVQRGTGQSSLPIETEHAVRLAGKTGTTDDYTNAWFVGFSPQIVCGVWVGNEEGMTTIGDDESGARAALPIWRRFMDAALDDERWQRVRDYQIPPNIVAIEIDRRNGLLASEFTPDEERIMEFFVRGTEPNRATSYEDDYNLRLGSIRLMEKRVDIRFEHDDVVKPREYFQDF